jgi:ABC-type antimicrobial peptide transport system permease subunit
MSDDRLIANLTTVFGLCALMLACLGLYGTISYNVTRRITELGLRMALGADRAMVAWMVVREAILLVAVGASIGVPLAILAGRRVLSLLHGINPLDPLSYALATALLVLVGGLAAFLPAYRASRVEPMVALRAD